MDQVNSKNFKRSVTLNDVAVAGKNNKPVATGTVGHTSMYKMDDGLIRKVNSDKVLDSKGNPADGSNKYDMNLDAIYGAPDKDIYIKHCDTHNKLVKGDIDKRFSEDFTVGQHYILVRALWEDIRLDSGLVKSPPVVFIPQTDDSGYILTPKTKQFPFLPIVRLINASKITLEELSTSFGRDVKIGDYLMVDPITVEEEPKRGTKETWLKNSFVHYDSRNIKVQDQVGYLLLKKYDVQGVINEEIK